MIIMGRHFKGKYGSIREIHLSYPDGQGTRVTRKFLSSIIERFAIWNINFWEHTKYFPIIFMERQIMGGIYKALVDSGAQVLSEPPIKRKMWGKPEKFGWADFIAYLNNTMYFLELKYTYCRLNHHTKGEIEWLKGAWNDAYNKVKSIRRAAVADWVLQQNIGFGVVLHGVLVYQRHKRETEVQPVDEERVIDYIKSLDPLLNPEPHLIWVWTLPQELQKAQIIAEQWENYPAVCFFVHLVRLPIQKG